MSTVQADIIQPVTDDPDHLGVNVKIGSDALFVSEGGADLDGIVTFGTIKGYMTTFFQSTNILGGLSDDVATFGLSSVADVSTGTIRFSHANNFIANEGYVPVPNDGNYGRAAIHPQDTTTSQCDQFSRTENHSLSDSVLGGTCFIGELA